MFLIITLLYVLYSSLIAGRSLMTAYRAPCRKWQSNIRLLVRLFERDGFKLQR